MPSLSPAEGSSSFCSMPNVSITTNVQVFTEDPDPLSYTASIITSFTTTAEKGSIQTINSTLI
jgi:hypothetical protein